jgi:hypothetical protein
VCGNAAACPPDIGVSDGRVCRAGSETNPACDGDARCDGAPTCPATNPVAPRGTECRALNGTCDVAESCDGSSRDCPSDAFDSSGRECRAASRSLPCDAPEFCGGGRNCPSDIGVQDGRMCGTPANQTAAPCDADSRCNGSTICPPNPPQPMGASRIPCNPAQGVCDRAEYCDGERTTCPTDAFEPDGAECSEVAGSMGTCSMGVCCPGVTKDYGRGCEIEGSSLVFVTSVRMTGAFGGLADGDKRCNDLAAAANLAGEYRAWLSTMDDTGKPEVNARDRIGNKAPWRRINDGAVVLESLSALADKGLSAAVLADEWGIPHDDKNQTPVWTGTLPNGGAGSANCQNWAPPEPARASGYYGYAHLFAGGQWTFNADQAAQCGGQAALYCFQADGVAAADAGAR